MKGYYLLSVTTFVDDPDRRAREECLNAFRERLLQSCNALPETQRQVAKNVANMRSDLRLDDMDERSDGATVNGDNCDLNRNFLMVFHLAKSAVALNPTAVRLFINFF